MYQFPLSATSSGQDGNLLCGETSFINKRRITFVLQHQAQLAHFFSVPQYRTPVECSRGVSLLSCLFLCLHLILHHYTLSSFFLCAANSHSKTMKTLSEQPLKVIMDWTNVQVPGLCHACPWLPASQSHAWPYSHTHSMWQWDFRDLLTPDQLESGLGRHITGCRLNLNLYKIFKTCWEAVKLSDG